MMNASNVGAWKESNIRDILSVIYSLMADDLVDKGVELEIAYNDLAIHFINYFSASRSNIFSFFRKYKLT